MQMETGYILVVDDNEMNRDMLSRRLSKQGHLVEIAVNGRDALELFSKKKFDLILLDIMMPEISGLEVLTQLRKKYTVAELPIIMVTAKDQSEDIVEALKLGANDYVTKPVDFPVASARVQTQLKLKHLAQLKDEFLSIASHDLKNPLSGIIGYVSVLQMLGTPGQEMDDSMKESITRIGYLANVMHRIILDFLDFQAMDDGQLSLHPEKINLNDLASLVVVNNIDASQRKGIELKLELAESLPLIEADSARLQQVLENFVSNSIKFSKSGNSAVIRSKVENNLLRMEVSDTGPGLKEEDMNKLFVKYARLSNKPTGGEKSSGLGLAICKKVIELHHGKIGAQNNPGHGSTFWFEIPLQSAPLENKSNQQQTVG